MKGIVDFLSGNVPGGITVYFVVMLVVFFVLFYLYRNSELFTGKHFRWWFLGSWLVITLFYVYLWRSNPPALLLKRYTVFVTASESQYDWLAHFYRDEISSVIRPYRDQYTYFFPQRWAYLAGVEIDQNRLREISQKVAIDRVVWGKIVGSENELALDLTLRKYPEESVLDQASIDIDPDKPQKALAEALQWLQPFFPLRESHRFDGILEKSLILARNEFYEGNYEESHQRLKELLNKHPDDPLVKKWYYYSLIKHAGGLRADQEVNPFETRKKPYQVMLSEAREYLKNLIRENLERDVTDDFLNNMMAESYLWEENFDEAEIFLRNGYAANPFNILILENLTYLHPSRYEDLGFKGRREIEERIIDICPIYADVLMRHVETLLRSTPVHGVATKRAKRLIENFLAINPHSATSWLLLGEYYHASLNREKAFEAFFKADSLEPDNMLVQFNLGVMYYLEEAYDQAETHFKKAIEVGDYLDAHLYLGSIYMKRGEYEKALERFRYRVAHKKGEDDYYAREAMKGIRQCLEALNIPIPGEAQ